MIKLTYRGITYKTKPAVNKLQKVDSTCDRDSSLDRDANKTTGIERLDYYTYRGVSYIKLPIRRFLKKKVPK